MPFLVSATLLVVVYLWTDAAQVWYENRYHPEWENTLIASLAGGVLVYVIWVVSITLAGLPGDIGPMFAGMAAYLAVAYAQRRWRKR